MRATGVCLLLPFLAALCLPSGCDVAPRKLPPIEVYFSPQGGCTDAIVKEIDAAKKTVRVQAYSFTSRAIARRWPRRSGAASMSASFSTTRKAMRNFPWPRCSTM